MFEQSFALSDVPRVFMLGFLELLLSADNAVVLGVVSRTLPPPLRSKALFIGVASSFVLRAGAILAISFLFENIWVQLAGAVYLLYLSIRYFTRKKDLQLTKSHSLWKTVLLIEFLDLVFAIDSIVAGVAFIDHAFSKLWIVYVGGMIGLIGMRFAADLFGRLLDWFPRLETSAYLMVGLIGLKLAAEAIDHPIPSPLFWTLSALLFLLGFIKTGSKK